LEGLDELFALGIGEMAKCGCLVSAAKPGFSEQRNAKSDVVFISPKASLACETSFVISEVFLVASAEFFSASLESFRAFSISAWALFASRAMTAIVFRCCSTSFRIFEISPASLEAR